MQSEPKDANKLEPNTHSFPPSTICSQPWWRGGGVEYNAISPDVLAESASKSPSMEHPNGGVGAKAGHSQPNGGLNEGAAVNKEMQTITAKQSGSDGNYGQEHQHLQHVASAIPPSMGEYLVPPQMELVGHSIACAPYPYSDPYYGGIMTAYGPQALVQPHLLGMHHTRMPLPLEMAEEPVYVNAKQYHGILRRRQSRAKAELEKKVVKVRKPYLHESRHQHAVRRARGCGGRFLNTKNLDCNATNPTPEKAKGSGAVLSTLSASSTDSESETLPSDSTGHLDCSSSQQEIKEPLVRDMHGAHTYHNVDTNGNSNYYQHHHDHLSSTYCSLSGERGEEGDCSGQQRGSIPVNRAPHRTLTIQ